MQQLTLATWNINSVRIRTPLIQRFLSEQNPDILCLQEIKCLSDQFPRKLFEEAGYPHIQVNGQKAYHGVATVSRVPLEPIQTEFCPLGHARHVSSGIRIGNKDFELHNFYVPAGGDVADIETNAKFAHKMDFLDVMRSYFETRYRVGDAQQVIVGDFNIAPHENDVWSSRQLQKVVSHTPGEREMLESLRESHGFIDTSRRWAADADKLYSWWSYRAKDVMKSNRGRRLDHIWVSPAMEAAIEAAHAQTDQTSHRILTYARLWEKPSDHVPMLQTLDVDAL